jgi:hypothetical protein
LPCATGVSATINSEPSAVLLLPTYRCENTTVNSALLPGGQLSYNNLVDITRGNFNHPWFRTSPKDVLMFGSAAEYVTLETSSSMTCDAPVCYVANTYRLSGLTSSVGTLTFVCSDLLKTE